MGDGGLHAAEHIGRRVARNLHDRCDRRRRERPLPVLLYRADRTTRFDADLHARNASKRVVGDRRRIARLAQSERSDAQTRCGALRAAELSRVGAFAAREWQRRVNSASARE